MSTVNTGTRDIPLKFAKALSAMVNAEWESGRLAEKATPVTRDLLRFWFGDSFCETRAINFHVGQKQAILNTIYLHEVIKTDSVFDMYAAVGGEITAGMDLAYLKKDKFSHPKYCMKLATGTGKTWVLSALLIWQYLNAKHEETASGRFFRNFLIVAPGLIVYERLLDAYLGKETAGSGSRNFDTSDFRMYEELFIPPAYKETVFGFIQSNVVKKDEIGRKVTGDGLIAITNWHLLSGEEEPEDDETSPLEDPTRAVKELLPVTPGTSAGHSLETLDNQYLSGGEIEYLAALDNLVVINDEAHHIHETKKAGIVSEVEWQKSLNRIAEGKGNRFIQIDFSATPYDVTGSGQRRTKHYFAHVITDFDLKTAIHQGLVKTLTLDKRKEIATMELDFKAIRDGSGKVIGLSDGQKLMLRAGLEKLKILERQFVELTRDNAGVSDKHPKMLVICEDTTVSPHVVSFLVDEGLAAEDVMQIDSNKKGEIPKAEWQEIKQRLFNMDKHPSPKVAVSVLMLREGFDVSNICVIVPLRSTQAPILLEQVIGRGLRLMWREPDYQEIKNENRIALLKRKKEPSNYLDILSIVEHPAFIEFYDELAEDDALGETHELPDRESVLGDIIRVGLKSDYAKYDLYWPVIVHDKEETLQEMTFSADSMEPVDWYSLDQLKKMVPKEGETFFSEEVTVKTRFGEYRVTADLFTAKSYNEFLAKLVKTVTSLLGKVGARAGKEFPLMQINNVALVKVIDGFIRTRLFKEPFDPFVDNNWKVLLISKGGITEHIVKETSGAIYEMQNNIHVEDAVVLEKRFSEIDELKMRENYSIPVAKSIYERLPYPSNKGELERNFILYCDGDAVVDSLIKINENYHHFAHFNYIRTDGMLASYYPDFIVKVGSNIYLVETKAQKDVADPNVKQKELGALDRLKKINELARENRMECEWGYVLLGETTFYTMRDRGATVKEIMEFAKLTARKITGALF